jgi:hypothetical protein
LFASGSIHDPSRSACVASALLCRIAPDAPIGGGPSHDASNAAATKSGIYHYKGERWYGRTKHGAYACEKEAIKAGDRASLNGQ